MSIQRSTMVAMLMTLSLGTAVAQEATSEAAQRRQEIDASAQATLDVPADAKGRTIHVILEVTDAGEPALTRYRRIVVNGS